jgi:hypothetical protein
MLQGILGVPFFYPYALNQSCATSSQYLAEQRQHARVLHYLQRPVNQPTPTALLAQEYDEFPDQQSIIRVLGCTRLPQDKEDIGYIMASNHTEMQHHTAGQTVETQQASLASLCARIGDEQGFARHHADAEKFLAEAETYLDEFLPPDQESDLLTFQPFDLPDTPVSSLSSSNSVSCRLPQSTPPQVPTSTSDVPVQDELLLEDVIDDSVVTDNRRMSGYRFEVRDTLESILDCLYASTLTKGPIELVPVPFAAAETSSMQVNVNEEGTAFLQEGKGQAKEIPYAGAVEPFTSPCHSAFFCAERNCSCCKTYFEYLLDRLTELDCPLPCSPSPPDSARMEQAPDELEPSEDIGEVDAGAFFLCCEL